MKEKIIFTAENKLCTFSNNKTSYLASQPLNTYIRNVMEIQKKNEWKSAGIGAAFMNGIEAHPDFDFNNITTISSISPFKENYIIYALNIENNTGIHTKNILDDKEPEGFIIRKNNMNVFHLDYQIETGKIATCVSDDSIERHIAIFNDENSSYQFVTEGDCLDQNPSWSKKVDNTIFYDSCGIARNGNSVFAGFGSRGIYKLDLNNGELSTIISDEKIDFIKPCEDRQGNLYYMKKPYKIIGSKDSMSFFDILSMPVKLLKAVFGWLNFFTQRYAGQSLKTSGNNPAKSKEKSAEEVFIEGNLVNIFKTQRDNEKSGEQFPGLTPKSWELVKRLPDGSEVILKSGVLDFCVCENGDVIYSNGIYLIKINIDGSEQMLEKVKMATSISCF